MDRQAKQSDHRAALVLQGGGALAAYEWGAIERLYDGDFRPDLIAGVSLGAIHAAILAAPRGETLAVLRELWTQLRPPVPALAPSAFQRLAGLFGIPGFFRPRADVWNAHQWTGYYDMRPLGPLLEHLIDFPRLFRQSPRLLVTATDVRAGSLRVFDSDQEPITVEHLLASCALPPAFPPVPIAGELYWDGGIVDNSPLAPVVDRLDPDPDRPACIVAIELFSRAGQAPSNLLGVHDRVFEIIFQNRIPSDYRRAQRINDFARLLALIDAELPADSPARRAPGFHALQRYKLIEDIVLITSSREEVVFGPFDFSLATVRSRREAGYADADRVLGDLGSGWRAAN